MIYGVKRRIRYLSSRRDAIRIGKVVGAVATRCPPPDSRLLLIANVGGRLNPQIMDYDGN